MRKGTLIIYRTPIPASVPLVGELAGRSPPVRLPIFHHVGGFSDMDLGNKEYPRIQPRFNIYNIYTMYKRVSVH